MRRLLIAAAAVAVEMLLAVPQLRAQPGVIVTIDMQDYAFEPHTAAVAAGTMVRWLNHDDTPHHVVTEQSKTVDSGLITPGSAFSFTFSAPGRFAYRCAVHPTMLGVIEVR
jgi:plastocyanin